MPIFCLLIKQSPKFYDIEDTFLIRYWATLTILKGQYHKKVGEVRVWGVNLAYN
jgi:hypothetical protein